MSDLPFFKYTSFGNNFVIVDEIDQPILSETEKQRFAFHATNSCFGVGSDNFIVVQPCSPETLGTIDAGHSYWEKSPIDLEADYVFRMFEPTGDEAFSCGNGLMCVARYLYQRYGILEARIMTEIPTTKPKVITVGTDTRAGITWANMGHPRRVPQEMVQRSRLDRLDKDIDQVQDLLISKMRHSDKPRFSLEPGSLNLSGYLVFTGEPHLVIFTDNGFSVPEAARNIFPIDCRGPSRVEIENKRVNTSTEFIRFVGDYFRREYASIFPAGININFVRVRSDCDVLEYRCFERGINRETLACGTGATATAFVASRLGRIRSDLIKIWPHRCRWYDQDAELSVEETPMGWILRGRPTHLFEGRYCLDDFQVDEQPIPGDRSALADHAFYGQRPAGSEPGAGVF